MTSYDFANATHASRHAPGGADALSGYAKNNGDALTGPYTLNGDTLAASIGSKAYPGSKVIVETCNRLTEATGNGVSCTSGQFRATARPMVAGAVIHSISFLSGTTAMTSPTHQWFAILNSSFVVVGVTADDTSTAWATSSIKTLPLTVNYTVPTTDLYYIGRCVVASGMPTSVGFSASTIAAGLSPVLSGSITGQTSPPALAATLSLSVVSNVDYGYCSTP